LLSKMASPLFRISLEMRPNRSSFFFQVPLESLSIESTWRKSPFGSIMTILALVLSNISSIKRATKYDFPLPDWPTMIVWCSKELQFNRINFVGSIVSVPMISVLDFFRSGAARFLVGTALFLSGTTALFVMSLLIDRTGAIQRMSWRHEPKFQRLTYATLHDRGIIRNSGAKRMTQRRCRHASISRSAFASAA
jgi:hypothetical protein